MLGNNEPQFRSSIYDHSTATNHYTFGRTSYYVNNGGSTGSNLQNFQHNVNMTLNFDRSTTSTNGGFATTIRPQPLSLSVAEATLNHHLCQPRPAHNQHQTLLMPRSCSDDLNVESNTWRTQQKYKRHDRKGGGYQNFDDLAHDNMYMQNENSQTNSLYQDIETCRADPQYRQSFNPTLYIQGNENILTRSSDQPFLLRNKEPAILPPRRVSANTESNPYAVPGEHHLNPPPLNVLHANRQTSFQKQNVCKLHENHYQNVKESTARNGELRNTYSTRSNVDHLSAKEDENSDNASDIWQRDTSVANGESPR